MKAAMTDRFDIFLSDEDDEPIWRMCQMCGELRTDVVWHGSKYRCERCPDE